MKKNIEDFPLILNAKHVSEVLGVSRKKAYAIMNSEGFPLVRLGHSKRVEKEKFFSWLDRQANN
jgi:predicted DNA-binding transcriptional regulator AlpA